MIEIEVRSIVNSLADIANAREGPPVQHMWKEGEGTILCEAPLSTHTGVNGVI